MRLSHSPPLLPLPMLVRCVDETKKRSGFREDLKRRSDRGKEQLKEEAKDLAKQLLGARRRKR